MSKGQNPSFIYNKRSLALDVLSGYLTGIISILYLQPMEICKVRIQNDGGTILRTVYSIVRNEGFFTLWRGTTMPLIFGGTTTMIVLSSQKNIKEKLMELRGNKEPFLWQYIIAGFSAGVLSCPAWTLSEYVKTQMQMDKSSKRIFKGSFDCIRQTTRKNGLLGLYKGFTLCALREGTNVSILYTLFDLLKKRFNTESLLVLPLFGAISSLTSWSIVSFIDNAKVRYQSDDLYNPRYNNLRSFIKQHSFRDYLGGFKAGAVRHVMHGSCVLPVFTFINKKVYQYSYK